MLANPYVLVATVIGGLIATMWILKDSTDANAEATERHNQLCKEQTDLIDDEKNRINGLISTIQDETKSWDERNKAFLALKSSTGSVLDKYTSLNQVLREMSQVLKDLNGRYETMNENMSRDAIGKTQEAIKAKESQIDKLIKMQAYDSRFAMSTQREINRLIKEVERDKLVLQKQQNVVVGIDVSQFANSLNGKSKAELDKIRKQIDDAYNSKKSPSVGSNFKITDNIQNPFLKYNFNELGRFNQAYKEHIKMIEQAKKQTTDFVAKKNEILVLQKQINKAEARNKKGREVSTEELNKLDEKRAKLKTLLEEYKKGTGDDLSAKSNTPKRTTKKETLPEFDTEKAQRDHNRQIQDDLFAREESRIKIMKDGAEKRLSIIQLEYDKQEEEIRRRSEDQLNAFIETEKQKAEAQGKWKKGQAFDTNTPTINAEKARLAENEKVLLASNAEYQRMQQEQLFKELLDKYKTYEQERTEILKQFEEEREQLEKNNINGRYNEQIAQSKKAQKRAEYELRKKHKVDGDVVGKLFEDFSGKSIEELEAIQEQAEKTFSEIQKYADPEILSDYRERLEQLKYAINGLQTPFARLATAFKNISLGKTQEERKKAFGQAIDSMRDINEISTQVNDAIGAIANGANISGLKHLTESFKEVQDVFSSALNWGATGSSLAGPVGGVIGMGIGIATSYFNSVAKSEEENARRRAHYKEMQIQYEETLNKLQLERILNEKHSNNFATDKISRYVELLDNLKTKQNELANGAKKLQETYVLKETKPFFTNYLSAKMYKDEKEKEGYKAFIKGQWSGSSWTGGTSEVHHTVSLYKKLKDVIGELVDEQGKIDTKKLKSLNIDMREFNDVGGDLINDVKRLENAKNLLRRLQEVQGEIEKVRSEVNKYVKETFGVLGNDFAETIVNSVEKGESAIENFGKTVTKVMRNFIKDFLVTKEIKKMFDDLENELTDIRTFTKGDQETVTKTQQAIINFVNNKLKPVLEKGQEKAKTMYQALEQSGIKMFDEQNRQTVEKGFARMSQDSADELNGQFRLMTELEKQTVMGIEKMYQSMQTFSAQQLKHLAGIEVNTYKLHNIENVVSEMKSEVSSVKTILGNIETKGIKMR